MGTDCELYLEIALWPTCFAHTALFVMAVYCTLRNVCLTQEWSGIGLATGFTDLMMSPICYLAESRF